MKKFISVILTLFLVFTSFSVFAENNAKIQEVLLSVKERIGVTDEFDVFLSDEHSNRGITTYNFSWKSTKDNNKRLNITATTSGLIIDYYFYDGEDYYSKTPAFSDISIEDAKIKAQALISSLNPMVKDKIIIEDNGVQDLYQNGFSFSLKRVENGIPVMYNTGNIRLNSDATKILSFNMTYYENLTFSDASEIMTLEDAQKIYNEKIGMELEYRAKYDYKGKAITAYPVYIPIISDKYVNAITGELEEFLSDNIYVFNEKAESVGGATNDSASRNMATLSDAEMEEFEKINSLKSKDELLKIIKNNKYIKIDDDLNLINYYTSKSNYENKYTANFSFEKSDGEYKYAFVAIDMKTGEIITYYNKSEKAYNEKSNNLLKDAEIFKLKEEAVTYFAGNKKNEYKYNEEDDNYIRYINGIPFKDNNISIDISKDTGEITSYRISYNDIEFPDLKDVISIDAAIENLFLQVPYEVFYGRMNSSDTQAKLIYVLRDSLPHYIDAYSGKLLNYSNEEYKPESFTGYTDIEGHYAENQIETLAKFGICFEEENCKPDSPITQKDFIALLVSTFKSKRGIVLKESEAYSSEYMIAESENIISTDEMQPNEPVTREISAKFFINAMGYQEIANISHIYSCPFSDVYNYKGHISILKGLNIIKGNGNDLFNPNGILTRADAMIMIFNYLSR